MKMNDSAIGTLVLAPVFLALACGAKVATDEVGARAVGTSPSAGGPVGVNDPGAHGCTSASIHVASGMPHGNSDFDLGFSCEADAMGGTGPIGYFVAGQPNELVITGCARPGLANPGIRFVVPDVSGPSAYSTNAISFVDPMLSNWNYQGALPSNQLGWTTTITGLGPVGESISGTYIGRLTSNADEAYLMGTFTVCRAPDRQGH